MLWLGVILIGLGAFCSIANWGTLYSTWREKKYSSPVPFIGGFFLASGLLCVHARSYWGFAILADCGTITGILGLPFLLNQICSTAKFNRLHVFRARDNQRNVDVSLYRRGIAVIRFDFHPPIIINEHGAGLMSSGEVGNWKQKDESFEVLIPNRQWALMLKPKDGGFICEDTVPSANAKPEERLDGLRLLKC